MGVRIRTTGVHLPPPTPENLERMARAYYEQSRQLWAVLKNQQLPDFDEQDKVNRDIQMSGMRAAYASLALSGGANPEPIEEQDDA